jgi:hypothetical protein
MMSINDCFFLMGWIFLGLLLVLPLGRKKKGPAEVHPLPSHFAGE